MLHWRSIFFLPLLKVFFNVTEKGTLEKYLSSKFALQKHTLKTSNNPLNSRIIQVERHLVQPFAQNRVDQSSFFKFLSNSKIETPKHLQAPFSVIIPTSEYKKMLLLPLKFQFELLDSSSNSFTKPAISQSAFLLQKNMQHIGYIQYVFQNIPLCRNTQHFKPVVAVILTQFSIQLPTPSQQNCQKKPIMASDNSVTANITKPYESDREKCLLSTIEKANQIQNKSSPLVKDFYSENFGKKSEEDIKQTTFTVFHKCKTF